MTKTTKKRELLDGIAKARLDHLKWKSYFEVATRDITKFRLDNDKVNPIATECEFGHWLYGDGQNLNFSNILSEIERVHEDIHKKYFEIIKTINRNDKSVFTSKSSYLSDKQFIVDNLILDLNNYSSILRSLLTQLELFVQSLDEEEEHFK